MPQLLSLPATGSLLDDGDELVVNAVGIMENSRGGK
jgi:hypothetical protein